MQCRIELKVEKSNVTINSVSVSMSSPVTKNKPVPTHYYFNNNNENSNASKGNLRESRRERQRSQIRTSIESSAVVNGQHYTDGKVSLVRELSFGMISDKGLEEGQGKSQIGCNKSIFSSGRYS